MQVEIGGQRYLYRADIRHDPAVRTSWNALAMRTF